MVYKIIIIVIFCLIYVYKMILDVIGIRSVHNPIPENVKDVYDQESYRKWQSYYLEKYRLGFVSGAVDFIIDLVLLAFNLYAAFAGLFPKTLFFQMFAVLLLTLVTGIAGLPFSWRDTMVLEEKYGFNRTTKKTFIVAHIRLQPFLCIGQGIKRR